MSARGSTLLLAWLFVVAGGCSAITDFSKYTLHDEDAGTAALDGGDRDAGTATDAYVATDGHVPDGPPTDDGGQDAGSEPARATTLVQTSGGAVIVTPDYRLSISVGAPQPMGDRATASRRLSLGLAGAQ